VATSGNVTAEVWKKYNEEQKSEVPDDNFKVVVDPQADRPYEPQGEAFAFYEGIQGPARITARR